MGKGYKFDYSQFEEYVKDFQKATDNFDTFLKKFLLQQAQRVIRAVKPRTPVDTGTLRESWVIGKEVKAIRYDESGNVTGSDYASAFANSVSIDDVQVVGDSLQITISNPMEYASYIEYGHHSYLGRYMLTISMDEISNAMSGRFEKEFRNFLIKWGVK